MTKNRAICNSLVFKGFKNMLSLTAIFSSRSSRSLLSNLHISPRDLRSSPSPIMKNLDKNNLQITLATPNILNGLDGIIQAVVGDRFATLVRVAVDIGEKKR